MVHVLTDCTKHHLEKSHVLICVLFHFHVKFFALPITGTCNTFFLTAQLFKQFHDKCVLLIFDRRIVWIAKKKRALIGKKTTYNKARFVEDENVYYFFYLSIDPNNILFFSQSIIQYSREVSQRKFGLLFTSPFFYKERLSYKQVTFCIIGEFMIIA